MASHIFWIDSVTRRLVAGFNSSLQAETPVFVQGDRAEIEIHLLSPTGNLATIYAELDLGDAGVRLAIGRIEAKPTSGSFRLAAGEDQTPPLAFNASAEALQSALNALPSITALGGVTVQGGIGGPWFVYYTQPGVRDLLATDPSLLLPISQVLVTATRAGTESVAAIHQVKLKQSPAAYQDDWTDLPPADVLVERKVPGGPGANEVQRIKLLPAPYGGSYTLRFGNETTTPLSFSSSAQNIQDALWTLPSIGDGNVTVVEVTTGIFDVQFTGTLANAAQELLSGDGTSLLVHGGKLGALELNTPNVEDLLSGQDRVDAVLEVEITIGGAPRTYLQTPCVVLNDMIEGALPVPIIPFARAVLTDAQGQVIAPSNFWAAGLAGANAALRLAELGFSNFMHSLRNAANAAAALDTLELTDASKILRLSELQVGDDGTGGGMGIITALGEIFANKISAIELRASGQILASDGTALNPGLSFTSDPDTGLRRVSSDRLGLSVGAKTPFEVGIANDADGEVWVRRIIAGGTAPDREDYTFFLNADDISSNMGVTELGAAILHTNNIQGSGVPVLIDNSDTLEVAFGGAETRLILASPNGTRFIITVSNAGAISVAAAP